MRNGPSLPGLREQPEKELKKISEEAPAPDRQAMLHRHSAQSITLDPTLGGRVPRGAAMSERPSQKYKVDPVNDDVARLVRNLEKTRALPPQELALAIKDCLNNTLMSDMDKETTLRVRFAANPGALEETFKRLQSQKLANGKNAMEEVLRIFGKKDASELTKEFMRIDDNKSSPAQPVPVQLDPVKNAEEIRSMVQMPGRAANERLFERLSQLTPEERAKVTDEYQKKYNVSLKDDLKKQLNELGYTYAEALLEGKDPAKTNAIGLYWATKGAGRALPAIYRILNGKTRDEIAAIDSAYAEVVRTAEKIDAKEKAPSFREALDDEWFVDRKAKKAIELYLDYAKTGKAVGTSTFNPVAVALELEGCNDLQALNILNRNYTRDQFEQIKKAFGDLTEKLGTRKDVADDLRLRLSKDEYHYAKAMIDAIQTQDPQKIMEADVIAFHWAFTKPWTDATTIQATDAITKRLRSIYKTDEQFDKYLANIAQLYNGKYESEGLKKTFEKQYEEYKRDLAAANVQYDGSTLY